MFYIASCNWHRLYNDVKQLVRFKGRRSSHRGVDKVALQLTADISVARKSWELLFCIILRTQEYRICTMWLLLVINRRNVMYTVEKLVSNGNKEYILWYYIIWASPVLQCYFSSHVINSKHTLTLCYATEGLHTHTVILYHCSSSHITAEIKIAYFK